MTIPSLPSSSIAARHDLCINADTSTEFAIEDNNGNLPSTGHSEVIDDIGGENEQYSLTNPKKTLFPAMNDPMPNAGDAMVGEVSPRPVRRSERNRRRPPTQPSAERHSPPTTRSRWGTRSLSPPARSGRASRKRRASTPASSTSSIQMPTRRLTRIMHFTRAGPSHTPLPDAFSATEPVAETCRFVNMHRVMEHAMVEAKEMLLGQIPIGSGPYIDTEEKYLAAMSVLPYCPQTSCGVGDLSGMVYFATFWELNEHTRLFHPDIETTYQPPEANYHEMFRLLGF